MSNNQNKSYVVLPGGKECKLLQYQMFCTEEIQVAIGESIPLTEVMRYGETFDGSEVYQYKFNDVWVTDANQHVAAHHDAQICGMETRIAIKPKATN